MAVAVAKGRLRGKKPKLSVAQERHLVNLHRHGAHTTSAITELFDVACSTVYRAIQQADRPRAATLESEPGGAFTGGDNFRIFTQGTNAKDSGLVDRHGWIKYLQSNSPVSPDFAGRNFAVANGAATITGKVPAAAAGAGRTVLKAVPTEQYSGHPAGDGRKGCQRLHTAGSAEERVGHLRVDQVRSRLAGLPRLPHPRLTELPLATLVKASRCQQQSGWRLPACGTHWGTAIWPGQQWHCPIARRRVAGQERKDVRRRCRPLRWAGTANA